MNCWYIFIIFCAISMMALVCSSYVAAEDYMDTNKTEKYLELLETHEKYIDKRRRRQPLDLFGDISGGLENENEEELRKQMLPKCNLEFCKSEDCGGTNWNANEFKNYLKSAKELNYFLNNVRPDNKKAPREIVKMNHQTKQEKEYERDFNEKQNCRKNLINLKIKNRHNGQDFRLGNKGKSKNHIGNEQNLEYNFLKSPQIPSGWNTDLSSCQHCSRPVNTEIFRNNSKLKADKHSSSGKFLTKSNKPYQKSSDRKYYLDDQPDEDDYDYNHIVQPDAQKVHNFKPDSFNISVLDIKTKHINSSQKALPKKAVHPLLNDQRENIKNNLSHEANYKLSKDEQDTAEHKNNYLWKWGITKRSYPFNAMNEIKLKTSSRLLKKGFGASLPSYSLAETRKDLLIDDWLRRRANNMPQEKNRKLQNFYEKSDHDEFKESNKPSEDLPMETDPETLSLRDWNRNSQKRVYDSRARYKREQHDNSNKAFDGAKDFLSLTTNENQNLKALNRKALKKLGIEAKRTVKALSNTESINSKHLQKALTANNSTLIKAYNNYFAMFDDEDFLATLNYLKNNENNFRTSASFKPLRRGKRLIGIKKSAATQGLLHKTTEDINIKSKFKIGQKLFKGFENNKTLPHTTEGTLLKTKALKYSKLNNLKLLKQESRLRVKRRSLAYPIIMATNSAGHENWLTKLTKILSREAHFIQQNIKSFIKQTVTQLFLQNRSDNKTFKNSQQPLHHNLANESFKALKIKDNELKAIHVTRTQVNETFKKLLMNEQISSLNINSSLNKIPKNTSQYNKSLKRFKRSLEFKPFPSQLTQKSFKSYDYDDFYKPEFKFEVLPDKLMNDISELEQMGNKPPVQFESYNFVTADKPFNLKEHRKTKNNQDLQKLNSLNRLWLKNKPIKPFTSSRPQEHFLRTRENFSNSAKGKDIKTSSNKNAVSDKATVTTRLPLKIQNLKDRYLQDLQNFNKNYKFNENDFNRSKEDDNLSLEMRNEILNCKAFASLEEFIKSLPKNLTESVIKVHTKTNANSTFDNEMDVQSASMSTTSAATTTEEEIVEETSTLASDEHNFEPIEMDIEQITESSSQATVTDTADPTVEENTTTSDHQDYVTQNAAAAPQHNIKLNLSINANVQGNTADKQFCGNGSFNVVPLPMDERRRREILLSPLENIEHNKLLHKTFDTNTEDFHDLMSGKLTSKLVKTIMDTVQQSPQLKALWPSLKRNQQVANAIQTNFYVIKNQQNEQQLKSSEKLLAQVMSSLNDIIEQQARSESCVPLRPDLQEFYNLIIQTRQQQDLFHLLDGARIQEQTSLVKKLLDQYENLNLENQQQVAFARNDLLDNLLVLSQLQDNQKHQQGDNEAREKRADNFDFITAKTIKNLKNHYSAEFLKLLNAAQLYRDFNNE